MTLSSPLPPTSCTLGKGIERLCPGSPYVPVTGCRGLSQCLGSAKGSCPHFCGKGPGWGLPCPRDGPWWARGLASSSCYGESCPAVSSSLPSCPLLWVRPALGISFLYHSYSWAPCVSPTRAIPIIIWHPSPFFVPGGARPKRRARGEGHLGKHQAGTARSPQAVLHAAVSPEQPPLQGTPGLGTVASCLLPPHSPTSLSQPLGSRAQSLRSSTGAGTLWLSPLEANGAGYNGVPVPYTRRGRESRTSSSPQAGGRDMDHRR